MKGLNYIIKNVTNATFFSLLSGGVFVSELDNAQRFTSEADAMLCMGEHIDGTDGFAKFGFDVECFIAPLIEDDMFVKYRDPSDAEEAALIFTVIDATNQDWILMQAINRTLAMPPIEGINSIDLAVISTKEEKDATEAPRNKSHKIISIKDLPVKLSNGVRIITGEDTRIDVETADYWTRETEEEYNTVTRKLDKLTMKGKGYEVYVWFDVSGFDYWVNNMKEENYAQITVNFDKPFIKASRLPTLARKLDIMIDKVNAIINQ